MSYTRQENDFLHFVFLQEPKFSQVQVLSYCTIELSTQYKKYRRILFQNPYLVFRFGVVFLLMISLLIGSVALHITTPSYASLTSPVDRIKLPQLTLSFPINPPQEAGVAVAQERQQIETEKKIAQEKVARERQEKIDRTLTFLRKKGSPVANEKIAAIIVDKSAANGADYRVVLAISGIESGFCNASFNYNCFGFLNGVKYSSYEAAFNDLVPKVSKRYATKYGWDFEGLAKAYGMQNWQYHSANMRSYASSI